MLTKAVAPQVVHRRLDCIRFPLEGSKPFDEGEDGFDVGGCCRTDGDLRHRGFSRGREENRSCFDRLSTNGKFAKDRPFALSPSTSLRTGLSKPVVSLSNQANAGTLLRLSLHQAKFTSCGVAVEVNLADVAAPSLVISHSQPVSRRQAQNANLADLQVVVDTVGGFACLGERGDFRK